MTRGRPFTKGHGKGHETESALIKKRSDAMREALKRKREAEAIKAKEELRKIGIILD